MPARRIPSLALALLALAATAGGALAQSAACRQARTELASLGSGGGARDIGREARRQRVEIERLQASLRGLECGAGGFWGDSPDCAAVAGRLRGLEASYGGLIRRVQGEIGLEQRRRRLAAQAERACAEPAPTPVRATRRDADEEAPKRLGGSRLVCVRACAGFIFPLQNRPRGRADADDMCQALCPAAQTAAHSMPFDGSINEAVSSTGKPYAKLANALKYTQGVDRSCACRKPGQTWAEALRKAEGMIARNRGDVVVTAAKAEELSRPKLLRPKVDRSRREVASKPEEAFAVATTGSIGPSPASAPPANAETRAAAKAGETAPTATRDSSGIGTAAPEQVRLVGGAEGPIAARPDGERRVRLIAPDVVAIPRTP